MSEPTDSSRGLTSGSNLDQLMPVVLFFALFNLVNITAAVVASTAWSVKAAIGRHRRGLQIGWWLPSVTIYLIIRAAITVAVEEEVVDFGISPEAVFFGIGFATKFLIAIALIITIVRGTSAMAWGVPKVVPLDEAVLTHPRFHTTMRNATWLIVLWEILSASWDIWLFNNSGFNTFFLTRSAVNFVASFFWISAGLMYIDRGLDPIEEYPGLTHVLETSGRISS